MPTIQTQPKGKTLFYSYKFYLGKEELQLARLPESQYYDGLKAYLDAGHDLSAPISIAYSFPLEGTGISTSLTTHEMVCTFTAKAPYIYNVVSNLANYGIADVSFLADYELDWNAYFEFAGSYNDERPLDGTPLHFLAFYSDDPSIAESLIALGAEPNILNSSGYTPAQEAEFLGHTLMADYLNSLVEANPEYQEPITHAMFLEQHPIMANPTKECITPHDVLDTNTTIPGLETTDAAQGGGIIENMVDGLYSIWQYFAPHTPQPIETSDIIL